MLYPPIEIAILVLAYFFTIIGVITTVILENRNPLKTSAWVLIVGFIPIVGLLAYVIFGQEQRKLYRINKRYYKRLLSLPRLWAKPSQSPEVEHSLHPWTKLISLAEANAHSLLLSFDDSTVYTDGASFYDNLQRDLDRAKLHIHLESYIFEDDEVFDRLAETLIRRRSEGLDVRIIYDYLGSYDMPSKRWLALQQAGIQVYPFLPVKLPLLSSTVNYRNHRKICIIDNHIGYIGGMNFAKRYKDGDALGKWRDTHLRIVGQAVSALQTGFLMDWYSVSRRVVHVERFFPKHIPSKQTAQGLSQFIFGGPLDDYRSIEQALVSLILQAKRYIRIQTPYFLPTESLYNALVTAVLSGISVELMIPKRGDSRLTMLAVDSYLAALMEAGVQVYRYSEGFIHSKVLIADDELLSIGSANMDFRSLEHNFEVLGILYDKHLAKEMNSIYDKDIQHSEALDPQAWALRSPLRRLAESSIRLFAPLL